MTDPIADMLTRIRNAQAVNKGEVIIPFSKLKMEIAKILTKEGFIESAEMTKEINRFNTEFSVIKVKLRYSDKDKTPIIRQIKRISKPGRRVYLNYQKLPHVLGGVGIAIISTSKGLMTNNEARHQKVGGEVLCEIY